MSARWLTVAALAALAAPAARAADQTDLKRVFVLIAAERSDPKIVKMVDKDVNNFKQMLAEHLLPSQVVVREMTGKELTAKNVAKHYEKLGVTNDDALVFYYTGHGTYRGDGKAGGRNDIHTLEFQYQGGGDIPTEDALRRDDLRAMMAAKRPGLAVILTDCCSEYVPIKPPPTTRAVTPAPDKKEATPLGRSLFLQARGLVDVTAAADGEVAVCDTKVGSYFTYALSLAAREQKNRPVGWQAFSQQLKETTAREFVKAADRDKDVREMVLAKKVQTPRVFKMLEPLPGGKANATGTVVAAGGKGGFTAIALNNPTDEPLAFEWRWGTTGPWQGPTTAKPDRWLLSAPAVPAGKAPTLTFQVRIDGKVKTLTARHVKTDTKPGLADAAQFELPTLKPVGGKPVARARGVAAPAEEREEPMTP
jgi:hypothetical protein